MYPEAWYFLKLGLSFAAVCTDLKGPCVLPMKPFIACRICAYKQPWVSVSLRTRHMLQAASQGVGTRKTFGE